MCVKLCGRLPKRVDSKKYNHLTRQCCFWCFRHSSYTQKFNYKRRRALCDFNIQFTNTNSNTKLVKVCVISVFSWEKFDCDLNVWSQRLPGQMPAGLRAWNRKKIIFFNTYHSLIIWSNTCCSGIKKDYFLILIVTKR